MTAGNTTVRLVSGGVLQVRQGVLRGAGPQGPTGPQGIVGPTGVTGPTGPTGNVGDAVGVASFSGSLALGSNTAETVVFSSTAAEGASANPLVFSGNMTDFRVNATGAYSISVFASFTSGSSETGMRRVGVYKQGSGSPDWDVSAPAPRDSGLSALKVPLAFTAYLSSGQLYQVKATALSDTDTLVAVSMRVARLGIGNPGPTGPAGPYGPTGPTGVAGPVGSSGSGYTSFETMTSGGGSANVPADGTATADQAIPYPLSTSVPRVPGWFKKTVDHLERRIVARYTDSADLEAKRASRSGGEVYYFSADGSYWAQNASTRRPVAQVIVSASAAPTSGTYAAGTLWVQI